MRDAKYEFVEKDNITQAMSCGMTLIQGDEEGHVRGVTVFTTAQVKSEGKRIRRYFRKMTGSGCVLAREYVRFRYDEWGNVTYCQAIVEGRWAKDKQRETVVRCMTYRNIHPIAYWDSYGNEWREEWGVPNPFEDVAIKEVSELLNLTVNKYIHIKVRSKQQSETAWQMKGFLDYMSIIKEG